MSWSFFYAKHNPDATRYSEEFTQLLNQPGEILLDRRRSVVRKIHWNDKDIIIKQSKAKDKSPWTRFTTIYRKSDAVSQLVSMQQLIKMGIDTTQPIFTAEKKVSGMTTQSRLLYYYREGSQVTEKHYPKVVSILDTIHSHGYVHRDPHIDNFLHFEDQVFLIDTVLVKNRMGALGRAYDWRILNHRRGLEIGIENYIPIHKQSFAYKIACAYFSYRRTLRQWKRDIRKKLGLFKQ